jgi:hypothetical protein
MKSTFTLVSFFLLVAAVHGSVLLETRANDQGNNQGKGNDLQNTQGGGNATFSIHPNCTTPGKPHRLCLRNARAKCNIPAVPAAGQPAGSGIQVTPATNQSSNGAPPSQGPPKCFNLTAQQDPNSGNTQPSSILVQFNNTSPTQGSQPPSNQTASPNADNNSSSGDPSQCVTFLFSLFRSSPRVLNCTVAASNFARARIARRRSRTGLPLITKKYRARTATIRPMELPRPG